MRLRPLETGGYEYELSDLGLTVARLKVDAAITLEITSVGPRPRVQVEVRIGGTLRLVAGAHESALDPEMDRGGLGPMLETWGARVYVMSVAVDGTLTIGLEDNRSIVVPPDPEFEAWNLNDDEGLKVVGGPGDRVSVFRPQGVNSPVKSE